MKRLSVPAALQLLPAGAGLLILILQLWLYTAGVDERGLLVAHHPAAALMPVVIALFFVLLFLLLSRYAPEKKFARLFPASRLGAAGCWVAAAGMLYAGISATSLQMLLLPAAVVGALSMGYLGYCRLRHLRPFHLSHTLALVFFLLHMVVSFRTLSMMPQLTDYIFRVLAGLSLILHAYHRGAVDGAPKSQLLHVFFNRCAVFFCLTAAVSPDWAFFLPMTLWVATDLSQPALEVTEE